MNLNTLGLSFPISEPFAEGMPMSAAQARTLNQTRLENISNQLRNGLKEIKGEGDWTDETRAQAEKLVRERDEAYVEFGMGRVGGTAAVSRDPVQAEARKLASDFLAAKLKERGTTLAKQRKENGEAIEAKIAELAANPKIVAQAEKVVAARKKGAALFDDIGIEAPAETAPAA